jgi:hypothetical protein
MSTARGWTLAVLHAARRGEQNQHRDQGAGSPCSAANVLLMDHIAHHAME